MAKFSYTAEKAGGEIYKGVAEAKDRFALYTIVRQEGGKIIAVEEQQGGWKDWHHWMEIGAKASEYDKILFARNLGAMLQAGLPLARSLAVMNRQTKNAKMRQVIASVESGVRRGESLHSSFAKFPKVFSKLFVAMVRAGEEGGDLPAALTVIADQMERMYNLKKKIRGAMIYPAIILIAIVGIGFLMMTQVVPTLAQTFAEAHAKLPTSTQIIIAISDFLVHNTILSLAMIVGAVAAVYALARTPVGKRTFEFIFLHIPIIGGIVRQINAARMARTMSSLLASGVDVLTALEIVGEVVQNTFFQAVIHDAQKSVGQGEPLSAAFVRREDLYPPFVGEMMSVGEETGQVAQMLQRLAIYYEEEVDRNTKDMSTIVEPFLMIIIGTAVGFFAVSMITPIYSLSSAIS